jgi:hypothetical protein
MRDCTKVKPCSSVPCFGRSHIKIKLISNVLGATIVTCNRQHNHQQRTDMTNGVVAGCCAPDANSNSELGQQNEHPERALCTTPQGPHHLTHQPLMMDRVTVSEMVNMNSILTWLFARKIGSSQTIVAKVANFTASTHTKAVCSIKLRLKFRYIRH